MSGFSRLSESQRSELKQLFEDAIAVAPSDREDFLSGISPTAPEVREELMSLLSVHYQSVEYFETLSDELIGPAIAAVAESQRETDHDLTGAISHYEILERAGAGGMGVVYKARDQRLGRIVALKFLPSRYATDSEARARFLTEAKSASALDHANIGVVYEIGEAGDDRPFIAMAWYDGETLKDKLRRGPAAIDDAVRIAEQLADALSVAHAAGIVHCDVKPANILLTRSGQVKLVDFGIARLIAEEETQGTAAAGTPAYMSPEQTRGAPVDARTDVWSLGVLIYEMLGGRRPFQGKSDSQLISSIRNEQPDSLLGLRGDAPAELVRLVEKCLAKDPVERYQSVGEIVDAFTAIRNGRQVLDDSGAASARNSLPGSRQRFVAVGALAIVLLAGTGAIVAYLNREKHSASSAAAPTMQTRSVAVLAFSNRDSTGANDHLASGFTEELIAMLGSTLDVNVSARASTMMLERRGLDPLAIGRQLGTETIVDGSLERSGNSINVAARLVNVADGKIVWSRTYDRTVTAAHEVQREITSAVANNMRLGHRLGAVPAAKALTHDIGAYELYVKGRLAWTERTQPKLEEAIAYFRGALERDPQFAEAHAAMGAAYVNMSNFAWLPPEEAIARAGVSTSRAIALDSSLAEAHAAHGFVLASRGDYAGSEASFRKAVELNPSFAWTYHYYALLLVMMERVDEAGANLRSSLALDPLSLPASATLAITEMMSGRNAEARRQFEHTLNLSPDFQLTLYYFGALAASEGRCTEATTMLEKAYRLSPRFPGVAAALAWCYTKSGRGEDVQRLERDLSGGVRDERSRINRALAHAVLGRPDTAFALLRNARWDVPTLIELRANPLLSDFRKDSRYASLVPTSRTKPSTQARARR